MATGIIKNHAIRFKTFSVDCKSATAGLSGYYCGERVLTSSETEGAYVIVPTFARKSGYNYPITVGYEGGSLRLFSPASLEAVTVGVALFYQ